jgi:hypothetical protein
MADLDRSIAQPQPTTMDKSQGPCQPCDDSGGRQSRNKRRRWHGGTMAESECAALVVGGRVEMAWMMKRAEQVMRRGHISLPQKAK